MRDDAKPTVDDLGVDVERLAWRMSGDGPDALQVAFVREWVLMRTVGSGDVLVFDHHEWDCFLRGVKDDEFDDAASSPTGGNDADS